VKTNLYFATLVSALGGFLFGFDTAVISGTTSFITPYFALTDLTLGFTVAIALIGTIIGSIVVGKPADKYGRNAMLKITALFYMACAIGCGLAPNWYVLLFARFLGGLAVGAASVVAPMYIAEISPAETRGRMVAFSQLNIVLGVLVAFFSNYLLVDIGPTNWRWMFGVQFFPALLFFLLLYFIPASPRWLVRKRRPAEAKAVLLRLGLPDVDKQILEIQQSLQSESGQVKTPIFQRKYRIPVLAAVLLGIFNQLSGINVIMYYAPMIFEKTGLSSSDAVQQAVIIGVTNLVFTVLAMAVIDKLGRKTLLLIGSVGMSVFLAMVGRVFLLQHFGGYGVLIYILGYIAFFAFSQGAVIWVFLAEIFPNKIRARGQAMASFILWITNAVISWLFPSVLNAVGGGAAFLFHSAMMMIQFFFVWRALPETRGVSLEELERRRVKE